MTESQILQRCPSCELPCEPGEDACSSCLAWLSEKRVLDHGRSGYFARQRHTRIVTIVTPALYTACWIAVLLIQGRIKSAYDMDGGRDLSTIVPTAVLLLGGFALYGLPGRTLHHYPVRTLIRRGHPRWWKGFAASSLLVAITVTAFELVLRPVLLQRGESSGSHSATELAEGVFIINSVGYAAVLVVLLWNVVAYAFFSPQNLTRPRRSQLSKSLRTR